MEDARRCGVGELSIGLTRVKRCTAWSAGSVIQRFQCIL